MDIGVNNLDLGIFIMSEFCIKPFRLLIFQKLHSRYLLYLVYDICIAFLLIWSTGSGAWVGPGVNN